MVELIIIFFFFFFIIKLFRKFGNSLPIIELTVILYILQHGISPIYIYNFSPIDYMNYPENKYYSFAIFSCSLFILGLYSYKNKFELKKLNIDPEKSSLIGRIFVILGYFTLILEIILSENFVAITSIFAHFKYIGVFALMFSNIKVDKVIIAIVFFEIMLNSLLNALLIEFIIFSAFLFMFFSYRYKINRLIRLGLAIFALTFIILFQSIKGQYRLNTWESNKNLSAIEKFNILQNLVNFDSSISVFSSDFLTSESTFKTFYRLNQGWQLSMVLNRVPNMVKYQNGEIIFRDIMSSFLPRFIWPEKNIVNDKAKFFKFTGHRLLNNTSMSVGLLGDFYLNFGWYFSGIFLFMFGNLIARLISLFYRKFIIQNNLYLIWIPYLLTYLVRPGNEFYILFNHFIKAFLIFYLIHILFLRNFLEKN